MTTDPFTVGATERSTAAPAPGPIAGIRAGLARMPLRQRVGLLTALAVGLAVTLTALAGYLTVRLQITQAVDENLLERARAAVATAFGDPERIVGLPAESILAADVRVGLIGANGRGFAASAASAPPLGAAELAVARGDRPQSVRTAGLDGETYRVVAVPTQPGLALVLGQPTAPTERVLDRLGLVSLLVGLAGVALAGWAGTAIARTALRPVERVTAAAERVAATGRLDPIDVEGHDELARLATAFNAMLVALDQARDRQRRLVADAGHELRTPLTSLRTNLDLLAQAERTGGLDPVERAQLVADVRAQTEELAALVADLVELSRDEAPAGVRERVDLSDIVRDAVARVRRRAPGVAFAVDVQSWDVDGDPQLLGRAVVNLLDNAAKWSPPGGTVKVSLHEGALEVVDEGPGISPADLPHVFDRFYRSAEARGRPGSGLGLAIVRAAAERHGGRVSAECDPGGGARFRLVLPSTVAPAGSLPPLA